LAGIHGHGAQAGANAMNPLSILSYSVTALGALMLAFFLAFIFLGKRIAGERGMRQTIKYKGLELRTSSLVTVLLVAAAITLTPLSGLFWLHGRQADVQQVYELFVVGRIEDESGKGLKGAKAKLSEIVVGSGDSKVVSEVPVESDGSFNMTARLEHGRRLKLETTKSGYRQQTVIIGTGEVNFPSVLVKEEAR
jgi:hypothetical protein